MREEARDMEHGKEVRDADFWKRLKKEHPVAYGMFFGAIITMNATALMISLIALTLQLLKL